MPKTTIKLKTWYCPACGYHHDYDPADAEKHALHHPGIPVALCPACFTGHNATRTQAEVPMRVQDDPAKQIEIVIIGPEHIEAMQIDSGHKDKAGKTLLRSLTAAEKKEETDKMHAAITKHTANKA